MTRSSDVWPDIKPINNYLSKPSSVKLNRGRSSKGKGKKIGTREHARGRREERTVGCIEVFFHSPRINAAFF